jgi:hypothetical protein
MYKLNYGKLFFPKSKLAYYIYSTLKELGVRTSINEDRILLLRQTSCNQK